MVFKKLMASMGAGGASVNTVLDNPNVYPGGVLSGRVDVQGGEVDQDVDYIQISLQAKVEVESGDSEYNSYIEFGKNRVTGRFQVYKHQAQQIPFQIQLPFETPPNVVGGRPIPGMQIGLRTELEIRGAMDKTDMDPIYIHPLPAQERILAALERMGWRFKSADMEKGHIRGSQLPFYQEIEFAPPPQHSYNVKELELTFLANNYNMDVVLEIDKRGGAFSGGGDTYSRFTVDYNQLDQYDWENMLDQHIGQIAQKRGLFR